MNSGEKISEEHLNAYIDNELDSVERDRVFEAINADPELNAQLSEIKKLKELVRYAYAVKHPKRRSTLFSGSRLGAIAAAFAFVIVGASLGWVGHSALQNSNTMFARQSGVVIQVSDNDPAKWDAALINAKNVRKEFPREKMDIEIVAYGPGLEMFKNSSRIKSRLDEATQAGVKLLACGNTMKLTNTAKTDLLPTVEVVKAGVVEIMQKQQQGYSYIRP